jgi:hypothetical protein
MKSNSATSKPRRVRKLNWTPLPDRLTEAELNIELNWTADARTTAAIERQAKLMGFESPAAYLHQALAAVIAGNEEDTIQTIDGRLVHGVSSGAYGRDGMPQDV